jgi:WD40 repeat protein
MNEDGDIRCVQVASNEKGETVLLTTDWGGLGVHVFDTRTWQRIRFISTTNWILSLGSDNINFMAAFWDKAIKAFNVFMTARSTARAWNVSSGDPISNIHTINITDGRSVTAVAAKHGIIACGLPDGCIKLYSSSTGDYITTLVAHDHMVTSLWIQRGCVISGDSDGSIKIWRIA